MSPNLIAVSATAAAMLALSMLPAKAIEEKWECLWSGGTWVQNGLGNGFCYRTLPSALRAKTQVVPQAFDAGTGRDVKRASDLPRLGRSPQAGGRRG